MVRTKHAVIVITASIIISVGMLAYAVLYVKDADQEKLQNQLAFKEGEETNGAEVQEREGTESVRESLKAAIKERESNNSNTEKEVIEVTPSEIEDTASADFGHRLVLGDGDISSVPLAGSIFACENTFDNSKVSNMPWIDEKTWDPELKINVNSGATWPNDVSVTKAEGARIIRTNGFPNHETGIFPINQIDNAFQYDKNPNSIMAQEIVVQLPLTPIVAPSPSCVPLGIIGVALNGVAIFNGLNAHGLDAVAHEVLDTCSGHPQETGVYHYHNASECLFNSFYEGADSTLIGYALDGFGIYASLEYGEEITNEDLDACHGHEHTIPWDGEFKTIYHYHATDEYPYTVSCFKGTPQSVSVSTKTPDLNPASSSLPQQLPPVSAP